MKTGFRIAALIALISVPAVASTQEQEEAELEQLRAAIVTLQREQERQLGRREDGMAELRAIELSLAASQKALATIDTSMDEQTRRLTEIAAEQTAAQRRLADEQDALAEQVRMSYMSGRQEMIRLLLSQDNPTDFGRMLVYYDYLNRHRATQIAAVATELDRLTELAAESTAARARLESLRSDQATRALQLEAQQLERRELLAQLDAAIEASGSRIQQMRAQEVELTEIITQLNQLLSDFPRNSGEPFAAQKGALAPPIKGEVVARFGEPRDPADPTGQLRWTGMVLSAETGTPVQAAYQGRVVYADWAPHMGLLLIVEHDGGYMSLYGHNRELTHQVGDWVRAGDVIARVGNSGGEAETALFFGIARDGKFQDPEDWLR